MSLVTVPPFRQYFPSWMREGLVLELLMNEGEGATAYDLSGYGNHGTIYGASWVRLPNGKWALSFDGVDDYVATGKSLNALNASEEYTFEVLFNPDVLATGKSQIVIDAAFRSHAIFLYATAEAIDSRVHHGGSPERVALVFGIDARRWYHAVLTAKSGEGASFYLNGMQEGSISFTDDLTNTHLKIFVGCNRPDHEYFMGKIAYVRIYNRALNSEEVKALYELGRRLVGI